MSLKRADESTGLFRMWRWWLTLIMAVLLAGCYRGQPSDKPPIHPNPDMDNQPRYDPQSESRFFADGSTMRLPVEGTMPRGGLREDDAFYRGRDKNGEYIEENPVPLSNENLSRGRERFDIYCSVCHGRVGDGQSIMIERGFVPPPSFHEDRIRSLPDGQIFDVITNGLRNMPSYRHQIPVCDRWLIIQYLRVLEKSQRATEEDIPRSVMDSLRRRER